MLEKSAEFIYLFIYYLFIIYLFIYYLFIYLLFIYYLFIYLFIIYLLFLRVQPVKYFDSYEWSRFDIKSLSETRILDPPHQGLEHRASVPCQATIVIVIRCVFFSSVQFAESPPGDLQITAYK